MCDLAWLNQRGGQGVEVLGFGRFSGVAKSFRMH